MSKPSEVQKILAKLTTERDILDRVIATIQLAAKNGMQPRPKRAPDAAANVRRAAARLQAEKEAAK